MSASRFLDTCYALRTGNQQLVVDMIFENVDQLLTSKRYEEADEVLRITDLSMLSDEAIIALLCITLAGRGNLPSRSFFAHKAREELTFRNVPDLEQNLAGLE